MGARTNAKNFIKIVQMIRPWGKVVGKIPNFGSFGGCIRFGGPP